MMPDSTVVANRFAGKIALITGANDQGIGGAIAERLCEEGASVALLCHREPRKLLNRLQRREWPHTWMYGSVTQQIDVDQMVQRCFDRFGRLDIVVNNAGVELTRPLEDIADDEWQNVLDVNLTGAMRVSRAALPRLMQPGGVIVNIASSLGVSGCTGFTAYSATKASMIGMTQSLAVEIAPKGLRAVCVAPGLVHSPMTHKYVEHLSEDVMSQIEACHPLGIGSPHDVAAAVAFLASEDARWITGITLHMGWVPTMPLPVDRLLDTMRLELQS